MFTLYYALNTCPSQVEMPTRMSFFVKPFSGNTIRLRSAFSACSARVSNCFCSCEREQLVRN
jgi:hypothetical protein